jgi:diaminopimelate decarboxylase
VKANPAPEILRLLESLGSSFDTASVAEIEMALDAGATPDRISFGNTIKKERDIARAHSSSASTSSPSIASTKSTRSPAPRRARACSAAS